MKKDDLDETYILSLIYAGNRAKRTTFVTFTEHSGCGADGNSNLETRGSVIWTIQIK